MKRTSLFSTRLVTFVPVMLLLLCLQSCVHYYYGPNSNNIPLLKKKGGLNISAALATSSESSGCELQSSYAFTKHLGAMANFYSASGKYKFSTTNSDNWLFGGTYKQRGSGNYREGGIGYFTNVSSPNIIFEIYGGAGAGSVTNNYSFMQSSKVSAQKWFLQPSIGYTIDGSGLEFALASRFSSVRLKTTQNTVQKDNPAYSDLAEINMKTDHFFWEPGCMIRGGSKKVKFQLQYTYSKENQNHSYLTQHGIFSFGMLFSFSTAKKTIPNT